MEFISFNNAVILIQSKAFVIMVSPPLLSITDKIQLLYGNEGKAFCQSDGQMPLLGIHHLGSSRAQFQSAPSTLPICDECISMRNYT